MAAMTKKKKKTMTAREKAERARIRKELRADGVLPPVKKPLNRKKFCEEARQIVVRNDTYEIFAYILWAFLEMLGHKERLDGSLSKEAVGAAKVILLAKRRMEFERKHLEETGSEKFTVGELCEAVKDIYEA